MATYFRVIEPGRQFFDANGAVLAGGLINTYDPGTTTPKTCYQDNAGASSHTNPIVLDAAGRLPAAVWTTTGGVKLVVTTAAAGAIFTEDDVEGVNDVSANSASEWTASGLTPTRTGNTTFTLAGDQTTAFHKGRRLRMTDSSTLYGRIVKSVESGGTTTVTVVLDSGNLSASLSAVAYGLTAWSSSSIAVPHYSLVAATTISAVASVSFDANTHPALFDGTFRGGYFLLTNIIPATDDTYLICQVGTGATPTYQTTGYVWGGRTQGPSTGIDLGSTVDSYTGGLALSRVASTVNLGTGAGEAFDGQVWAPSLGDAVRVNWRWQGTYLSSGANLQTVQGGGQYGSTTAITGVRFLMSSGNLASGEIAAYGMA